MQGPACRCTSKHCYPEGLTAGVPCLQSTRSYLYVEDVAEAFEVILRKGTIGETYNIGTQKERTVMDVAHSIAKHFSLPMDNIVHVRDRAFNDQRWDTRSFRSPGHPLMGKCPVCGLVRCAS